MPSQTSRPLPDGSSPGSLHGTPVSPALQERALEASSQAEALLKDPELHRMLAPAAERREVERARQVFVNRNLRLTQVDLVGFDMDYTLAIYHMRRLEQLSFDMTLQRLVRERGYAEEVLEVKYDHQFGMRGLVVDRAQGNIIKMDRFGYVGRAFHGRHPVDDENWRKLYRDVRVRPRHPHYASIDTLFALPEACMYAGIIELLESRGRPPLDYGKLYDDIRETIDTVHRDNSLKAEIRKDIGRYIFKDPELGPALHKLRSGGKKLFILTNSLWDYTQAVMSYLLDGVLAEYPSWRNYFDVVVTGAAKPAFFSEGSPFLEIDPAHEEPTVLGEAQSLERGKVYQGGNLAAFEKMTEFAGERVLYVGDHIYGDILKSKKTSLWRTCMVVQEIEDEINYTDSRKDEINQLSAIELTRARLDDEVNHHKALVNGLDRKLEKEPAGSAGRGKLEEERKKAKAELDTLRRSLKQASEIADTLERDVEEGFNPHWGLLFKEGNENSRFGEQVEQYACIYTSRVSNFLHYSPMQYFRSPRELMPHEQAGALSARMSPLGGEGLPKGE